MGKKYSVLIMGTRLDGHNEENLIYYCFSFINCFFRTYTKFLCIYASFYVFMGNMEM